MNRDPQLFKKLTQTRRGRTYLYPLLGSTATLVLFWFMLWKFHAVLSRSGIFQLIALGLLVAALIYRIIFRTTRTSLKETASKIDEQMDAHNQLEAMVELKNTNHPLRIPQQERAEQDLAAYKAFPWTFCLTAAALLLCITLSGMIGQVPRFTLDDSPKSEAVLPQEEESKDFAELELVKPESESRLKPLDEVAFEGAGRSSNGFDDLSLSVYLNGEPVAVFPLEASNTEESNRVFISGSFFLDELDAEPFDVITYHLTGHSEINGKKSQEVISLPHYIEVRPFKEDALMKKAGDGDAAAMIDILSFIHQVLEFELVLNKAVFTARAAGLQDDNAIFIEQISLLKKEQGQLKDELNRFLAEVDPELLTPNMLTSLRSAETYMEAAELQLAQLAPDNEKADTL